MVELSSHVSKNLSPALNGSASSGENGAIGGKANGTAAPFMVTKLSDATRSDLPAHVRTFSYDRSKLHPGIVHIGVGNFFRAHEAMYVDRCLHLPGQEAWGIVGIGIHDGEERAKRATTIKSQDGLYTLTEYAPNGNVSVQVIGSLIEYLHAPANPEIALNRIAAPETCIISLTITEGGYNIDEETKEFNLSDPDVQHDLANPRTPKTTFGYIVEALAIRRAAGLKGLTVLSCDNLRSNGEVTRKAVIGLAQARESELALWISKNVSFPNSMVDRIAPSVGRSDKDKANSFSGIVDETPVISESFTQWVVEDNFIAGRPSFDKVGVELRSDVAKFEVIKQRLLNGSHSMLAYPAIMCGYRLVDEALRQQIVVLYLTAFMLKDVIPGLIEQCPEGVVLRAYTEQIIERFSNPAVGDQFLRIAQNGVAKFPVYLFATFSKLLLGGGGLERVALCLASFNQYLQGSDLKGNSFAVNEPVLTQQDRSLLASGDPHAVLKLSSFATVGLADNDKFRRAFDNARHRLAAEGPEEALEFAARAE